MYDALLDELDDDSASRVEEAIDDLADEVVLDFDDADERVLDATCRKSPPTWRLDLDVNVDGLLEGVEEDESWSDDPVRMYLTQMGEIPLLSRQQEVALARQIEITRAKFRRRVLECDYVMQTAVKVLRRVQEGRVALRPHRAGVGDRPIGEVPDSRPPADEPADAGDAAEAESARLQRGHGQVAARRRSAAPPGGGWAAAAAAPCTWSRNSACARSGSSR